MLIKFLNAVRELVTSPNPAKKYEAVKEIVEESKDIDKFIETLHPIKLDEKKPKKRGRPKKAKAAAEAPKTKKKTSPKKKK